MGCGLVHRPDWINLDRHTTDAANLLADAVLLPFRDGSADAIEALQLVEHLGYVGTVYALHEWARVLTPGGTLQVETPDRDATLRATFSDANSKAALPWLFGLEHRGLAHRYLFSADEELAAQMFEAAVDHDPNLIWSRWNLARLYVREKRLLDALEHYEALQADLPAGLRLRFEQELDAVIGRHGRVEAFAVPLADPADVEGGMMNAPSLACCVWELTLRCNLRCMHCGATAVPPRR